MYWCNLTRLELLKALPHNCIVAEVGSYRGDFAAEIYARCAPARLELIDKWDFAGDPAYQTQANNLIEKDSDAVYRRVLERFSEPIAQGRVRVNRIDSLAAARQFAPGTFDWIYLDADHRYDAVRAELETYAPLLKADGILLGHDYEETTMPKAAEMGFGVTDAVRDFVKNGEFNLVLLTAEIYATYALMRRGQENGVIPIIAKMLLNNVQVLAIENAQDMRFEFETLIINDKPHSMRRLRAVR